MNEIDESHLTKGTQSQFLPGTKVQFAWDSTSLGLLKTCPRLYQYVIIEGWTTKGESTHLRFGIEYHKALEDYDHALALGQPRADAIRHSVKQLLIRTQGWDPESTAITDREIKAAKYKSRDTLLSLVIDYLDFFENDPAKTYIKADGKPAVELSFRLEMDWGPDASDGVSSWETVEINEIEPQPGFGPIEVKQKYTFKPNQPYLLCGHLDRVVDFHGSLYVMDRKTSQATLGQYYFAQYEPHNQMTLYTLAGQTVLHSPIKGVMIDAAQIMLTEPNRYVRGMTHRTPDQLEEWMNDLQILLRQAEEYANINHWPMNDTACDKFGGCKFREICSKDPAVRPRFLKANFIKQEEDERWNPLKAR